MKPIKWIIENFVGDNGYQDLIQAVKDQGHECLVLDVTNHFELKPEVIQKDKCIVFQGSIQLADTIKKEIPTCHPVVWLTKANYKCSRYYAALGKHTFNDHYALIPALELQRQKWNYYKTFGKDAIIFIRPDDGDKTFTGRLLDLQDFDKFWKNKIEQNAQPDDLILVSTSKKILGEWRFVVTKDQEIISYSTYNYMGQRTKVPGAPLGAIEKCREVLKEGYYPDSVFIIDICEDNDGKFWLLELGSFNSSGLYACDKTKIVKRVSEIALKEFEELQLQKSLPE